MRAPYRSKQLITAVRSSLCWLLYKLRFLKSFIGTWAITAGDRYIEQTEKYT